MSEVQVQAPDKAMSALRSKKYDKTNGSVNCGDAIALALAGVDFDALMTFAAQVGIDTAKYDHLNAGQKRMNVGNRLRTLVKKESVSIDQLAALARAPEPVKAAKAVAPDDGEEDEEDDD